MAACLLTVASAGAARMVATGSVTPGTFDILAVLPPPPVKDDARDRADRAIFRSTRRLVDTPRWDLATNDVKLAPADMLRDFSCSVGVSLTPENAPRTAALVARAIVDVGPSIGRSKDHFARPRPYLGVRARTCQPTVELKPNADYPSGHATLGWTWATLLAQLVPDRSTDILARGRAFGESRIVCGVHNASSVEAGRLTAAAALTPLQGDATFRADLDAARAELATLHVAGGAPQPPEQVCVAERALVAQHVF